MNLYPLFLSPFQERLGDLAIVGSGDSIVIILSVALLSLSLCHTLKSLAVVYQWPGNLGRFW